MANHKQRYIEIKPDYERFGEKLTQLIKELVQESKIDIVSIESRVKTIESFEEKINRPSKNYDDPLEEITDLCGIRIITYYTEDIYQLAKLIEKEFKIDIENSIDKTKVQSPDTFGYQSLHYVINLNNSRSRLFEWKNFKKFKAELQIRTILQHAWAAIDHKLRYKTKGEIPSVLKRKIYRLSALLELADEQFLTIKEETQKLNSEIEVSIDKGKLDLEFNQLSLTSYISNEKKINDIVQMAIKLGYRKNPSRENVITTYFYSRLIATLSQSNLKNIKDLDDFLTKYNSSFESKLKQFKQSFDTVSKEGIFAVVSDLLIILIILTKQLGVNITNETLRQKLDWPPMLKTFDKIYKSNLV